MSLVRFKKIEERLDALETFMSKALTEFTDLNSKVDAAVDNTANIIDILQGAKKVWGVTVKHWRTVMIFGAGIMTSAGVGNPKIWEYISTFLGA